MNDATQFFDTSGGGYEIKRSLRFNSSDSAYLSRTPASAGNRKTWTWSGWVKRSGLSSSTQYTLFSNNGLNDTTFGLIAFFNDQIVIGGYYNNYLITSAVYRDPSAWMHIVVAMDTTQATASNRLKVYVNGAEITTLSTDNRSIISQNSDQGINQAVSHAIGRQNDPPGNKYFSGYLADIHFIDGQALTPSDFTEADATTGQLIPKAYAGSYGTNGFHLPFSDNSTAAALGTDTSGNSNNWTVNNISVAAGAGNDSLVDTPTSYGTGNSGGDVRGNYATLNPLDGSPSGLSNGNLDAASANAYPTIIPGSGSWYYEVNGTGYTWDGTRSNWSPRSGSHNFGQRAFSGTPSSGFKALCDTNLPAPVIAQPSTVMDVKLYTGNGSTQTISGFAFESDLVWIKKRSGADGHLLSDTVRGIEKGLYSNLTSIEDTYLQYGKVSAVSSTGFTVAATTTTPLLVNESGQTYVAWTWDAGSSSVTNTDGSITSTVRANPSAGFSIVSWTGTTGATVGHGLNAAPDFVITKSRNNAVPWRIWSRSFGNTSTNYLGFDTNVVGVFPGAYWGSMTSTTLGFISSGYDNNKGDMVAYCFAPVAGYSSFGSYTGNGSADGPFVYTGFRPRWILIKHASGTIRAGTTYNWLIYDTARNTYNESLNTLFPNSSSYENINGAIYGFDILSNGFKPRQAYYAMNDIGPNYIYAAFAEAPFQYARAR